MTDGHLDGQDASRALAEQDPMTFAVHVAVRAIERAMADLTPEQQRSVIEAFAAMTPEERRATWEEFDPVRFDPEGIGPPEATEGIVRATETWLKNQT